MWCGDVLRNNEGLSSVILCVLCGKDFVESCAEAESFDKKPIQFYSAGS
jgi:hypothetical protein